MRVSVVIPTWNERGNIGRVVEEIYGELPPELLGEVIVVDDGSDDDTWLELRPLLGRFPSLHYLRHSRHAGKSAALRTGAFAARFPTIVNMDGDGQNDPRDIRALANRADVERGPDLVCGIRRNRVGKSRRLASRIANRLRSRLLRDQCPDTACGLKLYKKDAFLCLPFFATMHRFLPALFLSYGYTIECEMVDDRPRIGGQSKYTNLGRALVGLYDLFGIVWLRKRTLLPPPLEELSAGGLEREGAEPARGIISE